jgi:hypothetical protein
MAESFGTTRRYFIGMITQIALGAVAVFNLGACGTNKTGGNQTCVTDSYGRTHCYDNSYGSPYGSQYNCYYDAYGRMHCSTSDPAKAANPMASNWPGESDGAHSLNLDDFERLTDSRS